jgi:rhamnosyltransferase
VSVDIWISDDCSTDGTVQLLESLVHDTTVTGSINIVSKQLKFGSAAPNFFHLMETVDVSSYDYVALSDQDDIWFEDKLISAINSLMDNECDGYSSSVFAYWPDSGHRKLIDKAQPQTHLDYWFESPGPGCSQVFTSSSFLKFQSFLREHSVIKQSVDYHDWFLYAFYRHSGFDWYISDNPKMLYVQHSANQIGANSGFSALKRRVKLLRSGWYGSQILLINNLLDIEKDQLLRKKFLISNMFSLRRKKIHSLLVCLYLFFIK